MTKLKLPPLMIIPPVAFIALISLFYIGMYRDDPDALPSSRIGQLAPPVVLSTLPGKTAFDDASLRSGDVSLVNFWASWCAPCRAEHPQLKKLAEEGVTILGVNYKDQPTKALSFLDNLGDPYRAVGSDEKGRMALDWGLYGVPETFVIAGNGTVVLRFAGPITESVLENKIRIAMKEARQMMN